jgi:RNA polymerase sigma factor (sigma-70 family)
VKKLSFRDDQILDAIKEGRNQQILQQLYDQNLPKIKMMIKKNGGNDDQAFDIFQDGVIVLFRHVREGKFDQKYELSGFLYTICRNLWINYIKRQNRLTELDSIEYKMADSVNLEEDLLTKEKENKVHEVLSQVGDRCRELLKYSVFENLSMREICEKMGFSTENAAKTRNYKCKQKLLKIIEKQPGLRDFLSDY